MRLGKELLIVLYVLVLLLNDPQIARAFELETIGTEDKLETPEDKYGLDLFLGTTDENRYSLVYELDGGINSVFNPDMIEKSNLPFVLGIPSKEGYNFAGWYTDSTYQHKITEINAENAQSMVLFAKWTEVIDNNYNVETYSYHLQNLLNPKLKELKDCSYSFVDDVEIPGMPSTREQDYLNNLITSEDQCLQGLCFTPELILMTAYSNDADTYGALLVFDREDGTYLATLRMKKNSHLGGIAFDGDNVWICHSNSDTLERIPYEYILKIVSDAPGRCVDASELTNEYTVKNAPSCITCYGGRIWVATHTKIFNSEMVSYYYDEDADSLVAFSSYQIPNKVQGIAFDEKGTVYLSTSYGRNKSSYLKVYSSLVALNKSPNDPTIKIEMPPCSEEIAIAGNNVYVLFESASMKYFEGTDGNGTSISPIDKILQVDVASIW
jgi:uncharacterized repeat protein (TIGR02543 family)